MRRIVLLTALALLVGQSTARAQVFVYDAISDLTSLTTTGNVPHTYMGQAFNTNGAGGTTPQVTSMKLGLFVIGAHTYTDVQARVQFWGTFDPTVQGTDTTSVFSNPVGGPTVFDLGALTTSANAAFILTLNFATPVTLPSTSNLGLGVNFQGSTTGGPVADDTNLVTAMRSPVGTQPIPVGQNITTGGNTFYRNASGRTDFDFNGNDARTLGTGTQATDGIAFQLTAIPVPEPGSMVLCGLAGCSLIGGWWRRRGA
jgi:hypothetical protein